MVRRVQGGPRSGLGAKAGPKDRFVTALFAAVTLDEIAERVVEQAQRRFGCRCVRLVSLLGTVRHCWPATPLSADEIAQLDAALAGAPAPPSDSRLGATILATPRTAATQAVLIAQWPDADGASSPAWRAFAALVAARLSSVVELADQRLAVERIEQTARVQRALFAIADLASGDLDMPDMLERIHEIVGDLMYARNFYIALYDAERDSVRFLYFADEKEPRTIDPTQEIPAREIRNSLTLAVMHHGRPALGPSVRLRAEFGLDTDAAIYGPASADWLGVPMLAGGAVRGVVVVQSYDLAGRYSEEDRAVLAFVAQHILTALVRKQAHDELERRVEERTHELTIEVHERQRGEKLQAALYTIADLASSELAMSEMLPRIHAVVDELMYAKNFIIALYSAERDTLRFIYFADERDPGIVDTLTEIPAEQLRSSLTLALIHHGRSVMGPMHEVARAMDVPGGIGLGAVAEDWLGVPMIAEGQVRGAVVVQSYDRSVRFDEDDRALLAYVAQHILTALARKQAHEELERRVGERTHELIVQVRERQRGEALQAALYTIADLASGELDMGEMLARIHEVVGGLMYARNLYIALYDAERDSVRFIYFADEQDPRTIDPTQEIPAQQIVDSLTLAVIRHGRPALGPSARLRAEFGLDTDAAIYGPDSADWLGVPMLASGAVRGAVVVQSYDLAGRFSEDDRALLAFVAQHILTALVRKQAHDELERRVEERTHELTVEVRERQRGEKLQAALYNIADLASSELAMSDMLPRIHAAVGELMYARNFYIALYDAERDSVRFIYFADEMDPGMYDPEAEIPAAEMGNSLTLGLIRYGRSAKGSAREVAKLLSVPRGIGHGTAAEDWLGVPMVSAGQVRGVVAVQTYDPAVRFAEEDRALLAYVAQHILTALVRKQAQGELERRVELRTHELADAVRELRDQIADRERAEQQLVYETLHDSLTGLPNRSFLYEALERALARLRRDPTKRFAVLFLDLDRFKVINDSVGHLVGDEMLKEAGLRLAQCVRSPDVVARLGGDEFALLLEDTHGPEDACHVAQRVIDALSEPMRISGKELFSSASVGIALSNERYRSAEELLRDADVAMYRAKEHGRHRFEIFDERLHLEALRLLDVEGDLRRAIMRSEFEPHFQPIVRLRDRHVLGYEALLRWRHPERGVLLPVDFLAVAEENGSVEQIDWQMFDKTCREIPALGINGGYVTLNVSPRHFRSPTLAEQMLDLLATHRLPPHNIRVEVTEGALLDNPEQMRATLDTLRGAGVLAALDDFGTGYSSLSYLHRFPLHALKIDQSFVSALRRGFDGGSAAVVRAILALAGTLGMEVVAEGIETTEQRDYLIEIGCQQGQGFLFSRARPAAEWAAAAVSSR